MSIKSERESRGKELKELKKAREKDNRIKNEADEARKTCLETIKMCEINKKEAIEKADRIRNEADEAWKIYINHRGCKEKTHKKTLDKPDPEIKIVIEFLNVCCEELKK